MISINLIATFGPSHNSARLSATAIDLTDFILDSMQSATLL